MPFSGSPRGNPRGQYRGRGGSFRGRGGSFRGRGGAFRGRGGFRGRGNDGGFKARSSGNEHGGSDIHRNENAKSQNHENNLRYLDGTEVVVEFPNTKSNYKDILTELINLTDVVYRPTNIELRFNDDSQSKKAIKNIENLQLENGEKMKCSDQSSQYDPLRKIVVLPQNIELDRLKYISGAKDAKMLSHGFHKVCMLLFTTAEEATAAENNIKIIDGNKIIMRSYKLKPGEELYQYKASVAENKSEKSSKVTATQGESLPKKSENKEQKSKTGIKIENGMEVDNDDDDEEEEESDDEKSEGDEDNDDDEEGEEEDANDDEMEGDENQEDDSDDDDDDSDE